jgi:hypothetical protein
MPAAVPVPVPAFAAGTLPAPVPVPVLPTVQAGGDDDHAAVVRLLEVLVSAPLPERKDALEALAMLVRARPTTARPPLVDRLREQPASVRLPLARLLRRRLPADLAITVE